MTKHLPIILGIQCAVSLCLADTWEFPVGITSERLKAGDFDCEVMQTVKSEKRPQYPEYRFACFKGNDRLFDWKPFGADHLYLSDDGKFLLGVSNSGLHPTAFFVVSRSGEVFASMPHDNGSLKYCEMSISVFRKWAADEPKPEFVVKEGKIVDVIVTSCKEKRVSLLELSKGKKK